MKEDMILALDIGGTTLKYGLFSADEVTQCAFARQKQSENLPIEIRPVSGFHQNLIAKNWQQLILQIQNIIADICDQYSHKLNLRLGVSVAGIKDPTTGKIRTGNIPAIQGHSLDIELSDILKCPVMSANDADCFVLYESLSVAGAEDGLVFGIILGTGVGGGLVLNQKLLIGAHGFSGEWGHGNMLTSICAKYQIPSLICGCGIPDCLDLYGGARGVERLYRHFAKSHISLERDLNAIDILRLWEKLDQVDLTLQSVLQRTMACYFEILGPQLIVLINVLGPIAIPVGGGLGQNRAFVHALDQYVCQYALRHQQIEKYQGLLRPACGSHYSGVLGAATLAVQG